MYLFLLLCSLCLYQPALAALEIVGATPEISQNIQKRIDYKMRFPFELDERFLDQIKRESIEAIKPYGYFSPTINIDTDPTDQHIILDIKLNKISNIRSIDIEYTHPPTTPDIENMIAHIINHHLYSPFNNKSMDDISNEIKNKAMTLGYNDVIVTRGYTTINKQTHLADITYLVTLNEKNLFGKITYPEQSNAHCLSRFHNIYEGENFDPDKLKYFQKNMMSSGLYAQTTVRTTPRKNFPNIQDVSVEYTKIKPMQFFLGFGVKANLSESNLTPQAQANIDLNDLGGCGNTLNIGIQGSTNGGRFHTNALFPQPSGMHDFILLSSKINTQHYRDDDSSDFFRLGALLQYQRAIVTHQLSLNFLIEDSKLNNQASYVTRLFFPKYRILTKLKSKNSSLTLKAKTMIGAQSMLSDINFFQVAYTALVRAQYKKLHLRSQLSYGKIYTEKFSKYPLSMQFFLGGPDSNRGLSFYQINEGKKFLLSRNQVQVNIKSSFLMGAFFDTGFCSNPTTSNKFYPAYGLLGSFMSHYGTFECSIGKLVDDTKWVVLLNIVPGADVS